MTGADAILMFRPEFMSERGEPRSLRMFLAVDVGARMALPATTASGWG